MKGDAIIGCDALRDGTALVFGTARGHIHFRSSAPSGPELSVVNAHNGLPVASVMFLEDGTVMSGGHDGKLKYWSVQSDRLAIISSRKANQLSSIRRIWSRNIAVGCV